MSLFLAQINPVIGDFNANIQKMQSLAQAVPQDSTIVYALGAVSGYLRHRPDSAFLAQSEPALVQLAGQLGRLRIITAFWDTDFKPRIFVGRGGAREIYPAEGVELPGTPRLWAGLDRPGGQINADCCLCLAPHPFLPLDPAPLPPPAGLTWGLVNLAGGQDTWLFSGRSQWLTPAGKIKGQAAAWREDVLPLEQASIPPEPELMADVLEGLVVGIRDYALKNGFTSLCLGLSGGIDSAVIAVLAARALGHENVHALTMPSRYSSAGTQQDAALLAGRLGISLHRAPIESITESFNQVLAPFMGSAPPGVEQENLQARARSVLLMTLCNRFNHLLLATSNRSEALAGYATLYGDMTGGLAPLASLYKKEVYLLAGQINQAEEIIPASVIERAPSAELRPGQTDQDTLPPYPVLDAILAGIHDQGLSLQQLAAQGYKWEDLLKVEHLMVLSQYKRAQAPPEIPLRRPGLSLPLTARRGFLGRN